ncbi:MAG: hypothetical protein QHC89_28610 [Bosea sp. (in: a-proteobacteria)]|nr:hypothetical protein [Bosea sp. (in: a-proteobacteria)]
MAGYRHNPETGEREYVVDDAPAEQPASGPPMQHPGWVEDFLSGPTEALPFRVTVRPDGGRRRGYRRKSRRRG